MTNSQKMDKERDKIMEHILNLTLEIIYLMTGEDYMMVKKKFCENMSPNSHPCMSGAWSRSVDLIMEPSYQCLKKRKNNDLRILEVAQKMVELLTGEVPIRCQDVSVYFSMEEWEYLEGHKDLYKDIVMMKDQPPLTSPDGSSNRNTPERCPSPEDSWDCTQEHIDIQEDDQCEDVIKSIKVEVKEEEDQYMRDDEIAPEISTDYVTEDDDIKYSSSDDDGITTKSLEESPIAIPNLHRVFPSSDPVTHGWDPHGYSPSISHHRDGEDFPCSEGGECVSQEEDVPVQQGDHHGEQPYSCHKCEKGFRLKINLLSHEKSHTGDEQFSCSECGKCFTQEARLFVHQRTHTGVKPYSCSECGKCFIQRVRLRSHERTHTGMKPFFCAECGKCFAERSNLNAHQSCHAGVKPYSCSACGKSFHQRRYLISHERTHTGEKPFSCSECGRCFADRSTLARHQRTHSGEKPFSCSICGKRFTQKSNLITHEKVHTGEKPYSCSECGKCFSRKSYLISHEKTHRGVKA